MRLIFLGPPGVGKGTQAEKLSKQERIPHIATGDMLRAAIAKKTPVGLEAKSYIDAGKLVPDDVVIQLIAERLREPDTADGYILDGFPRTLKQAEALSNILKENGKGIDRVLYFDLNEEELVKRIAGRRSCPACQKVYHTSFNPPPREGTCACGATLVQRKDDRPETVKARLVVYRNETSPLIRHYRERNLLSQIDANGSVEAVTGRVKDVVLKKKSS